MSGVRVAGDREGSIALPDRCAKRTGVAAYPAWQGAPSVAIVWRLCLDGLSQ